MADTHKAANGDDLRPHSLVYPERSTVQTRVIS